MKGRHTRRIARAATMFVDHHSDLTYLHLQCSTNSDETLDAKKAFELYANEHGVSVRHYHSDNGRFIDNVFKSHVKTSDQTMTIAGVSAHHQNGKVEKRIRDIQDNSRTMLLHDESRWCHAIIRNLWPYAMRTAVTNRNETPKRNIDGLSPLEVFSSTRVTSNMNNKHPFGCPAYVATEEVQSSVKARKWADREKLGIYLGNSPCHARNISLILNPITGYVIPQYHVKHDDSFQTVQGDNGAREVSKMWQVLTGFRGTRRNLSADASATNIEDKIQANSANTVEHSIVDDAVHSMDTMNTGKSKVLTSNQNQDNSDDSQEGHSTSDGRIRKPRELLTYSHEGQTTIKSDSFLNVITHDHTEELTSLAASRNPDIMYYHQAMGAPDKEQFRQAMNKEVTMHTENEHWELMKRVDVPSHTKVLPSVWNFRRKRRLDTNEVYKHKARLNVHGGKQVQGENFWETYSPVFLW